MTPLAKWIFIPLSIAVVVAATLALRSEPSPSKEPSLTPAQMAELAPVQQQEPPKATVKPATDPSDLPPPPQDEPDVEDGNGS